MGYGHKMDIAYIFAQDRYPLQGPEVAYDIWAIHALHKNNETTNETIDNVKTIVSAIV